MSFRVVDWWLKLRKPCFTSKLKAKKVFKKLFRWTGRPVVGGFEEKEIIYRSLAHPFCRCCLFGLRLTLFDNGRSQTTALRVHRKAPPKKKELGGAGKNFSQRSQKMGQRSKKWLGVDFFCQGVLHLLSVWKLCMDELHSAYI